MSSILGRSVAFVGLASAMLPLVVAWPLGAAAATETTLHRFCAPTCKYGSQSDGIALDPASGNLFGVTFSGGVGHGGVVYEFAPGTGAYTVLYTFCTRRGCPDGASPGAVQPVIDTSGDLYGTTYAGGYAGNFGVVFELIPGNGTWREKVLHTFCSRTNCKDGSKPQSGLTYAGESAGQPYDGVSPLYGTTSAGGANNGQGTVFSIAPRTGTKKWTEKVLYSFCAQANCTDGTGPRAALSIDPNGNLFGTASEGGQFQGGAVFEVSPNGGTYTESVLYSFCAQANCTDGEEPDGGVMLDQSGNLFGTARGGGTSNDGVLFELVPAGSQWKYSVLANFDGTNGASPSGPLSPDGAGGVYGTTAGFTDGASATVFDFNGTLQTLYTFCTQKGCPDGKNPASNLILDGSGNLLGTTQEGAKGHKGIGGGAGTLFEISP